MKKTIWSCVVLALILSGCAGEPVEPTPEFEGDYVPVVSVTGKLVPAEWAMLNPQLGGAVVEVLVAPGDVVASGDLLVRFDHADAELAIRQAEAAVTAAQAQVTLLEAGARAEEIAMAEAQLEAAQAALSQAAAQREQLASGATEAEIAAARAQVAAAQAEQRVAQEAHDETMRCYELPGGGETCPGLGTMEEQARYALNAADEALAAARAQLDALLAGADDQQRTAEAGVWAASAQAEIAQAQLDLLRAGASAEEIAVAQAAVLQADAALAAAHVALERCELRAPFAGTVGAVYARVGELAMPGQPLIALGDLETLRVETTDLDEIDVARVAVGQQVGVTFDALPERVFGGQVTRISPMAESGTGAVHYTVIVELDEIDPVIRWGMTAFVDIEIEQ